MAFVFDEGTRTITMPPGDTGDIWVDVDWPMLDADAVVLFAIFNPDEDGDLLCKAAEIIDGTAHVRLCNADTRDIPPGTYRWQLRIVTDPERDEEGNVRADECTDHVVSVFNDPPRIRLKRGGAYV